MHRAENLTTFMCRLSRNSGALTSWNPKRLFQACSRKALPSPLYTQLQSLNICCVSSSAFQQFYSGQNTKLLAGQNRNSVGMKFHRNESFPANLKKFFTVACTHTTCDVTSTAILTRYALKSEDRGQTVSCSTCGQVTSGCLLRVAHPRVTTVRTKTYVTRKTEYKAISFSPRNRLT
jgi:transcription elongation factor Elf1